jgi:urea carboxylase
MRAVEVLSPGVLTTVQDWPGREGLWEVGVPPSGPMDDRSLRLGNRLLGNPHGAAGLEVTLTGPRLRFLVPTRVAITGAPLEAELDGVPVPQWTALDVPAGGVLSLGTIRRVGVRAYVLVSGGFGGALTMGSRAVFPAGRLGGRALRRGDVLPLGSAAATEDAVAACPAPDLHVPEALRIVLGPHGAPDFLTADGLEELLAASWRVHHHSDRTGIRLVGPRPAWARPDGGEAGLHPSNILDAAYSVGTVMLAGDMAVIVGPDGPSLGGFVAIGQVIGADRWRLGQLRAGDEVVLDAVDPAYAQEESARAEALITGRTAPTAAPKVAPALAPGERVAVRTPIFDRPREGAHGPVTYRRAGEGAVLVEFGEHALDLRSRVRAHALHEALGAERVGGLGSITPGVRSLHVQHDPDRLGTATLIDALERIEAQLPDPHDLAIPGRTVYLPLAWRHSEVQRAIERYEASVRADAPWCPDNIDFIRRINGLRDERAVREIVLSACYLVLGLGDVYLGAPVAVPLDPCHRLVTTKYNPARTWTPANAVGIGGVFLCVYGIEGPGGYQLVGRTVQMWHPGEDPPWRLRHFDQLRFEAVGEAELEELRAASDAGEWRPRTEPAEFVLADHERSLETRSEAIAAFTARRQAAFAAERAAWLRKDETAAVAA